MRWQNDAGAVRRVGEAGSRAVELAVAFFLAAGMLAAAGILLAHTVLKNLGISAGAWEEIGRTVLPEALREMHPEPLERWLFVLLVLASPFCVLAGLTASRLLLKNGAPDSGVSDAGCKGFAGIFRKACGGILDFIRPVFRTQRSPWTLPGMAALAGLGELSLLHAKSLFIYFVYSESPLVDVAMILTAALFLFAASRPGNKSWPGFGLAAGSGSGRIWRILVSLIAVVVVLLPRGLGVRSTCDPWDMGVFAWKIHFQAFAYSLTQVCAGKPLLTASPPLYGYYAEFLAPIFKLAGLSVFKLCLVMACIQAVATVAVVMIAIRFIRNSAVRFLCCAGLLYFYAGHCMLGRTGFDPYFQYWPVRFVFPAISIPLYLWAARRWKTGAWLVLGCITGCALLWNLESGIAVVGAVLVSLFVEATGQHWKYFRSGGRLGLFVAPAVFSGAFAAIAVLGWLFLQSQAGWKTPVHQTSEYQRLFYQYGLMMMPMPLAPHPWWLVTGMYLFGLGFSIQSFLHGRRTASARLVIFLSVLGTGLFTYYQGRSHDYNLLTVSWPALLLAFIFADRLLRAVRTRLLPRGWIWIALPTIYLGVMAAGMFPGVMTQSWRFGSRQWLASLAAPGHGTASPMEKRIAFIRDHVGNDRECVILADYQAIYFAETGLRSSLDMPGLSELFFISDLEALRASIEIKPPRHFFADKRTLERLHLAGSVRTGYREVAASFDGRISCFEPMAR